MTGTSSVFLCAYLNPPVPPALREGTVINPPFSMTLNWLPGYAMSHNPFINWMKLADPWGEEWGWESLIADGHINNSGDVFSVPSDPEAYPQVYTYALRNTPAESLTTGRFRLTWEGEGEVMVLHVDNLDQVGPNEIQFDYTADREHLVYIQVTAVTDGPLTDFRLVHENDWEADDNGEIYRAEWLDVIRNSRILRFKDWQMVDNYNGSPAWEDRTPVNSQSYMRPEGLPLEHMIEICNLVGADPWFVIPHPMENEYVAHLSLLCAANLDPQRHVYLEYTNKVWDFNLEQAHYCNQQGIALLGDSVESPWGQFYGAKAAYLANTFRENFDNDRFHAVMQVWTDNEGYHENFMLNAPDWVALNPVANQPPYLSMTEYAVHALLDGGLRYETAVEGLSAWIGMTMSDNEIYDNMALACRYEANSFDEGRTLEEEIQHWAFHQPIAAAHGMNMIVYEGGTHIVTPPSKQGDDEWNRIFNGFHYSPQWAQLMQEMINEFYAAGGILFNKHTDVAYPTALQNSGLLRWLGDSNPQSVEWFTQEATRGGPGGRGENDFIGPVDLVE